MNCPFCWNAGRDRMLSRTSASVTVTPSRVASWSAAYSSITCCSSCRSMPMERRISEVISAAGLDLVALQLAPVQGLELADGDLLVADVGQDVGHGAGRDGRLLEQREPEDQQGETREGEGPLQPRFVASHAIQHCHRVVNSRIPRSSSFRRFRGVPAVRRLRFGDGPRDAHRSPAIYRPVYFMSRSVPHHLAASWSRQRGSASCTTGWVGSIRTAGYAIVSQSGGS